MLPRESSRARTGLGRAVPRGCRLSPGETPGPVNHKICDLAPARLARHLRKRIIVPELGAEGQHVLAADDVVADISTLCH